ncbi:MAG: anti-sigma factor [Terriglobales bacterium]
MTCAEFQRELPEYMEAGGNPALQAHLKGCTDCSGLVTSLETIVREAQELQASEEPSPRVWNSIESILRQEKLIRQPQPSGHRSLLPSMRQRWGVLAWMVPTAAALLVGAGILLYQQRPSGHQVAKGGVPANSTRTATGDVSDEQLLQEVSVRAPLMRAAYESNLRDVNNYIRDAQDSVNANPNDEEAQQALMDAYGQKSMIYEMALDRSLP